MTVQTLFPTLVAALDHPEPAKLNEELAGLIRKLRDEVPPQPNATTVNRGWQSTSDLLDRDEKAIHTLRTFIDRGIQSYVSHWVKQAATQRVPKAFSHRYKGWAVILGNGGFQHQHVHSRMDLVGVYCVERPEPSTANALSGALTLIDPRTGRLSTRSAWETDVVSLPPVPGRLLLFPSFVAHRVETVLEPGERITINCDILIQPAS